MIVVYNRLIKITLLNYYEKGIKILCENGFKHCCFSILVGIILFVAVNKTTSLRLLLDSRG